MALVPYRINGAAADQHADDRLFDIRGFRVHVRQLPGSSGALRPSASRDPAESQQHVVSDSAAGGRGDSCGLDNTSSPSEGLDDSRQLANVGLVVWQVAFALAEYLLRKPPWAQWSAIRVVELGCGTGVTGIALALAGADVVLSDLPHVTPLAELNVRRNCPDGCYRAEVVCHCWGECVEPLTRRWRRQPSKPESKMKRHSDDEGGLDLRVRPFAQTQVPCVESSALLFEAGKAVSIGDGLASCDATSTTFGSSSTATTVDGGAEDARANWSTRTLRSRDDADHHPDLIVGADILYQPQHFPALLLSLTNLSAAHTVTFLAFRQRGRGESSFQQLAEDAGFAVQFLPLHELHHEFQEGDYHVMRLCLVDPPVDQ